MLLCLTLRNEFFFRNIGITIGIAVTAGAAATWKRGLNSWNKCFDSANSRIPAGLSEGQRNSWMQENAAGCNQAYFPSLEPVLLGTGIFFAAKGIGPTETRTRREFLTRLGLTTAVTTAAVAAENYLDR